MTSKSIPLVFVTGNKGKLKEVQEILGDSVPNLTNQAIVLPELQGEPDDIAKEKCRLAAREVAHPALVMVEDTSLCYNALSGLPGPYIKWFLEKTGLDGLVNLLAAYTDKTAYSQCVVAVCATTPGKDGEEGKEGKSDAKAAEPLVFVGRCPGTIVDARGDSNHFGGALSWDPVFLPDGYDETFAEMDKAVKNKISHRSLALQKLKAYFDANPDIFTPSGVPAKKKQKTQK